jgi:hypothetical protein
LFEIIEAQALFFFAQGGVDMEKKLYRVKVTLYVMAENESEACVAATRAPFDIFECSARKADRLDPGWEDAIPYNSDGERTCAEIFANREQVFRPAVPFPTYSRSRQTMAQGIAESSAAQASPG